MKRKLLTFATSLLALTMVLVVIGCSSPQATFEASVTSGTALLKVDFTNKSSKADEFRWDFGDGATMTTKIVTDPVSHDYTKAGTFTVTLTLVKNGKLLDTTAMSLNITVAHGPLDHVQLSPKTVDLDIGQSQQFTAKVLDAYGNQVSEAKITWETAGGAGSISENGVFNGGTKAGDYDQGVVVTAVLDNISTKDSASITIKPGPLDKVTVSPIIVPAGETKALTTTCTDQYGNHLSDAVVTWSLINGDAGSITADGSFKAGEVANTYANAIQVQVKQGDVTRTANADVQVAPGALSNLYIAPNAADIGISMTQQFVAVGADKYGNRITDMTINWSVVNGGGAIDSNGLFTAGTVSGDYHDTVKAEATSSGVTCIKTSNVTVEPDTIAFISDRDNNRGYYDIYTMDTSGNNIKRVTTKTVFQYRPTVSANGGIIVFSGDWPDGGISSISLDGKWQFTILPGQASFEPAISPDGKKIVYVYFKSLETDINVIDADGGNMVALTTEFHDDEQPAWSPDGKKIAFISDRDGNFEIYTMNADGSKPIRLTNNTVSDYDPQWSPDGTQILFHSEINYKWVIRVMDADGSNVRQVLDPGYDCVLPSWSPDGTKIVFVSYQDTDLGEISIANADGTNITRLTNNQPSDLYPIFLPRKAGVLVSTAAISIPFTGNIAPMSATEIASKFGGAVVMIENNQLTGSGIIIDPNGLILTTNTVVKNAKSVKVSLASGMTYTGSIYARDLMHDLAVIKINATGLPYVNTDTVPMITTGQSNVALGYSAGISNLTITSGHIASINFDSCHNITWIQTDFSLSSGITGGPIFDTQGNLIGIIELAVISTDSNNVSYAISINTIKLYIDELKAGQSVYQ
jgi:PKD repeat protein